MGAAYTPATPLLAIRGLRVTYASPQAELTAVSDVDLTLDRGEIVGLLGESGSGKSTLAATGTTASNDLPVVNAFQPMEIPRVALNAPDAGTQVSNQGVTRIR